MNRKRQNFLAILIAAVLLLNTFALGFAAIVSGVEFPDSYQGRSVRMNLVGCGVKRFLSIRVVGAALYMPEGFDADKALDVDTPKRLEVVYLVSLPKKELDRATLRGIRRNVSKEEFKNLKEKIDEVNSYWRDIKVNDRIMITYYPDSGMDIAINGEKQGTVQGADIAFAFYSVWIGEKPVDRITRETLLGIRPYQSEDKV